MLRYTISDSSDASLKSISNRQFSKPQRLQQAKQTRVQLPLRVASPKMSDLTDSREQLQNRTVLLRRVLSLLDRDEPVVDLTCKVLEQLVSLPLEDANTRYKIAKFFDNLQEQPMPEPTIVINRSVEYDYAESIKETDDFYDYAESVRLEDDSEYGDDNPAQYDFSESVLSSVCSEGLYSDSSNPMIQQGSIRPHSPQRKLNKSGAEHALLRDLELLQGGCVNDKMREYAMSKMEDILKGYQQKTLTRSLELGVLSQKRLAFKALRNQPKQAFVRSCNDADTKTKRGAFNELKHRVAKQQAFSILKNARLASPKRLKAKHDAFEALKSARATSPKNMELKRNVFNKLCGAVN